jgi:ribosome-associated toxin RatA of RatAB toxin-antitoxin module
VTKKIQRSAIVAFTPQQMFDLVNSIESYPQFMQGCVGATIISANSEHIEARLDLRKGQLAHSFVTRNQLVAPHSITMHLVEGPFKKLEGVWRFQALGEAGCKVSLDLEFEFKNVLVAMAASAWFESVANQLVDAVCRRAKIIYPK